MTSLHEWQAEFLEAVLHPDESDATHNLENNFSGPGLRVYHNNMYGNLRRVLRSIYPVVENLVGVEFFNYVANKYIQQNNSTCGDLNVYGEQFEDFLARFPPVSQLEYLPDTARLEWLVHQVYFSADSPPLALQALARCLDHSSRVTFKLNSACRLFSSPYPTHLIWRINQPDFDGDQMLDLSLGGVHLAVVRQSQSVALQVLTQQEYALLSSLEQKTTLSDLCQQVLDHTPDFDVGQFLKDFIERRIISDVSLDC